MPIYTKKGDKGETGLATGIRISKDSLKIRAIGAVDELDSQLGFAKSFSEDKKTIQIISDIQKNLLTIGSILAGSDLRFSKPKTTKLEKIIDTWDKALPPLKNFILPGGTNLAAQLHVCRSSARRSEREITALAQVEKVPDSIKMYMNRLSDFLFMFARFVNFSKKVKEEVWIGKKVLK